MTTKEKIQNRQLESWLHIGIWLLLMLVYALVFNRFMSFEWSLLRGVANVMPMAIIFYTNATLVNRYLEKKRYFIYGLLVIVLIVVITYCRAKVNALFPEAPQRIIQLDVWKGWALGAAVTNFGVWILSVFYQVLKNRYHNEQRNLAIINEQKEAQLQFLRAQINPHFLFNTLNNIYSLALIKSDKTAAMVLQLSNLLRYVIYDGRAEQVEIKREIQHIQQFVDLFKMKSEQPLDIEFQVNGTMDGVKIEPMILIPIVENCFKHCDFDTNENAFVKIHLQIHHKTLHFLTANTKNDQDLQKDQGGGVGLDNIRKRLELKYKDRYQLGINDQKDQFMVDLALNME